MVGILLWAENTQRSTLRLGLPALGTMDQVCVEEIG